MTLSPSPEQLAGWLDSLYTERYQAIGGAIPDNLMRTSQFEFFRFSDCGISAEMTRRLLAASGIDSWLMRGKGFQFDERLASRLKTNFAHVAIDFGHVVCMANADSQQVIIDAAYSQLFKPFGLDAELQLLTDKMTGEYFFTPERALVIPVSDVPLAAEWAAGIAHQFYTQHAYSMPYQIRNGFTVDENIPFLGSNPNYRFAYQRPLQLSQTDIKRYFVEAWNLDRYEPFESSEASMSRVDKIIERGAIDTSRDTL